MIDIQNLNLQSFMKFEFAKLYRKMQDIQTSTEAHNNLQNRKKKTEAKLKINLKILNE